MIDIHHLIFRYRDGDFCLRIPALHIATGTKAAIVGPSGCGKTTLTHLLAGILVPTEGQITVNGIRVNQLSDAHRRAFRIAHIGFVFQDFALLDYLTVLDNILHPYRLNKSLRLTAQVRDYAISLAAMMGLEDKLRRHIQHLSQGERQRVAICRALITRPALLLADEATGNLDPANKERILKVLFAYVHDHQATLVAVTHDEALLAAFDTAIDLYHLTQPTMP
jgi:putative ABC transport system ATP-binding protein